MYQTHELTRGDRAFGLIKLLIEGLHEGADGLTVERSNLLVDPSTAIEVRGLTGIVVLESNLRRKPERTDVLVEGLIAARPDLRIPYSLFYSLRRGEHQPDLALNEAGLWSIGTPRLQEFASTPMALYDSVYSLELHGSDPPGRRKPLGSGRGFLVFPGAGMSGQP